MAVLLPEKQYRSEGMDFSYGKEGCTFLEGENGATSVTVVCNGDRTA